MSLLDDVSIVVTPNGYKAGELYAVIPVPTEGAELVTNGDFATDSDWTKGTGWTISSGLLSCDGTQTGVSQVYQFGVITLGIRYQITFTVSNYSSGTIRAGADGSWGSYYSANGTYTYDITSAGTLFIIQANSTFVGSIDNVSVKEYTSADMDVTRNTAATRVDENGLVNYAEVLGGEEVTNGDFATDSDWTLGGLATISGGNANFIDGGSNTYSYIRQNISQTSTKQYLLQFEIKNYVSGAIQVLLQGVSAIGTYNSNGVYSVVLLSGTTNGYIEISRSYSGGTYSFSIDNVSVKEAARDNVPRIDYTGGGCPHILAEPQRTNLIPYSEDFTVGNWAKTRCTVTSNQAISPDGTLNADLMTSTDDDARLGDQVGSSGAEYTQSIYVKSAQVSDVNCQIDFAGLNTVTFTANQQWQRVETTLTDTSQSPRLRLRILNSGNSIYVWGGQVEQGSYATSYIPTDGSTVTRNQDIFTRDGIGSLINDSEGVLFVEMAALANDGSYRVITISDGTSSNYIALYYTPTSNSISWELKVGNAVQFSRSVSLPLGSTSFNKFAFKYKENDCKLFLNGVESDIYTSNVTFTSNTLNSLFLTNGDGILLLFGKVKQLQVYDTALTDTQLAALTS